MGLALTEKSPRAICSSIFEDRDIPPAAVASTCGRLRPLRRLPPGDSDLSIVVSVLPSGGIRLSQHEAAEMPPRAWPPAPLLIDAPPSAQIPILPRGPGMPFRLWASRKADGTWVTKAETRGPLWRVPRAGARTAISTTSEEARDADLLMCGQIIPQTSRAPIGAFSSEPQNQVFPQQGSVKKRGF